jgi:hypothetical protein
MRRSDRQPSPANRRAADWLALWVLAGVSALLGTVGWGWTDLSFEFNCADHFSCGDLSCPPCASRLHWVLAGAAGQWVLVVAAVLLATLVRLRLVRLPAVTLVAVALTPLAIIWYLLTTAVATSG